MEEIAGAVMELTQEQKFKFRLRAEQEAAAAQAAQPVATAPQASAADRALGSRPGRLALGAANTLVGGPFQLGANVGSWLNRNVAAPVLDAVGADNAARYARNPRYDLGAMTNRAQADVQASKERGMAAAGTEGFDAMGMLGGAAGGFAALRNVPLAATTMGRIGQGAGIGGAAGALAPVSDGDNYGESKSAQIGFGTTVGAALPAAMGAAGWVGGKARDVKDIVTGNRSGLERIVARHNREAIGEQNVPAVVNALRSAKDTVRGQGRTAAQALREVPEGSPIAAQQMATTRTAGGPSADFGKRWQQQQGAVDAAKQTRDSIAGGLRERALDSATNLDKKPLLARVAQIRRDPDIDTNDAVQKVLNDAQLQIENAATARNLYGARRQIQDYIDSKIANDRSVPQQAIPRLIEMKSAIDDAIEAAGGGKTWRRYLETFSKRSNAIKKAEDELARPTATPQKTNVPGGQQIAQQELPSLPNPLIREVMVLNRLADLFKGKAEPVIDDIMTQQFLNPQRLADSLDNVAGPQRALYEALMRGSRVVPGATAPNQRK